MKAIKQWFVNLVRKEPVQEFDAESDSFVREMRTIRRQSKQRKQVRRESWHDRNALERELLGGRER